MARVSSGADRQINQGDERTCTQPDGRDSSNSKYHDDDLLTRRVLGHALTSSLDS
jgi:hypothetical protein